ncbi:hypothetical protein GCM10009864_16130 [Streptomyces lunalinharesii]|uniref:Uncharacterized protein n=1 Tax=Streptomyces lunalinharesii TaxID=333384 RepID=A0ABP6DXB7_9ACTN
MTHRQLADEQRKLIDPYLPTGEYGPCPERLRAQFETGRANAAATIDVFRYDMPAESDFGHSPAIRSGELVHVSGQLAFDEAGEFLHAGGFAAQVKQTHANMDKVLDHYGATGTRSSRRPRTRRPGRRRTARAPRPPGAANSPCGRSCCREGPRRTASRARGPDPLVLGEGRRAGSGG